MNTLRISISRPPATRFFLCLMLLLIHRAPTPCFSQQQTPTLEPLFDVKLHREFPDAKDSFEEVRNLILKEYYNEAITPDALYWAAIKGMLRHISPPENPELATIWPPEEYEKVEHVLEGVKVAIGIKTSFNARDGSLTVVEVMPGSPAESALEPADRILRIDSEALKGKSLDEINALLQGEEGSKVTLTVNRDIKISDVTIERRKFAATNLIVTRLDEKTALAEIKRFTADISAELGAELKKLKEEGYGRLIIDLRNNVGGVFLESLRMSELFLPEKRILLRTVQRDTKLQNYVSVNKTPCDFDIAILVNKSTASSAEILAAALRDSNKAVIVGVRTMGKGVFERTFTLKNDFRVKFITGAMYSPRGPTWQGHGLAPDFLVDQTEETVAALLELDPKQRLTKDTAMITAYKLLAR